MVARAFFACALFAVVTVATSEATDFGPALAVAQIRHDLPILLGARIDARLNSFDVMRFPSTTVCNNLDMNVAAFAVADVVVVQDEALAHWTDACAEGLVFLRRHGTVWWDTMELNPGVGLDRHLVVPAGDSVFCDAGIVYGFSAELLLDIVHVSTPLARAAYANIGSVRAATNHPAWMTQKQEAAKEGTRCHDSDNLHLWMNDYALAIDPADNLARGGVIAEVSAPTSMSDKYLAVIRLSHAIDLGSSARLRIWFPFILDAAKNYVLSFHDGLQVEHVQGTLYNNELHFQLPTVLPPEVEGYVSPLVGGGRSVSINSQTRVTVVTENGPSSASPSGVAAYPSLVTISTICFGQLHNWHFSPDNDRPLSVEIPTMARSSGAGGITGWILFHPISDAEVVISYVLVCHGPSQTNRRVPTVTIRSDGEIVPRGMESFLPIGRDAAEQLWVWVVIPLKNEISVGDP